MSDKNYAEEYGDAVAPRKSDAEQLLTLLDRTDRRGYEHGVHPDPHQRPDMTKRLVAADALQEEGRDDEAALLRSPHPVNIVTYDVPRVRAGYKVQENGYPYLYRHPEHGLICSGCANTQAELYPDSPVPRQEVHWEGPDHICEKCNAPIESAYGDPDADEE